MRRDTSSIPNFFSNFFFVMGIKEKGTSDYQPHCVLKSWGHSPSLIIKTNRYEISISSSKK